MRRTRGITRVEALAVVVSVLVVVVLLVPMRRSHCAQAKFLKDSTQIRGIHQAWLMYSGDADGVFPTPGLIDRLPDPALGDVPGQGPEDVSANHTAALHSALIAQNYYGPEICVGPTEPSPHVSIKKDYDWDGIDPTDDVYWDTDFRADLNQESHISYASMPIAGERQRMQWKDTLDRGFALIGNRGVRNGAFDDPKVYGSSLTPQIHGDLRHWVGSVCFQDNHISVFNTYLPEGSVYVDPATGARMPDNIYRNDTGGDNTAWKGTDSFLCIITEIIAENGVVLDMIESWD